MSIKMLEKSTPASWLTELPPLGMDAKSIVADFRRYFSHTLGRDRHTKYAYYMYEALVLTLRDRLWERWKNTRYAYEADGGVRRAYYLSMEFLMGRALSNAMLNLGVTEPVSKALYEMGLTLEELAECENDAGPGQRRPRPAGGLLPGQLRHAAAAGDGLRHPLRIRHVPPAHRERPPGRGTGPLAAQTATPGNWSGRNTRSASSIGGRTEATATPTAAPMGWRWVDTHDVLAVPYDVPIPGYSNGTVNTLRLWSAAATDEFDLEEFNAGSYTESVAAKNMPPKTSPWCSTPTTPARTARSCACASSISWPRPACRTCWIAGNAPWRGFQPVRRKELLPAQRHPPDHAPCRN
jgi:starch phosphorylase